MQEINAMQTPILCVLGAYLQLIALIRRLQCDLAYLRKFYGVL